MKQENIEAVREEEYYHKVDVQILKRFFNGSSSEAEEAQVYYWFRNPSYEKAMHYKIQEHWDEFVEDGTAELNSERLLDKIHHKIHIDEWEKSQHKSFFKRFYLSYTKIAAAILFPLLFLGGGYLFKGDHIKNGNVSYVEIHSPPAARTHFELPDGSSGWLNSGSTLRFPTSFEGSTRELSLTGEAYFDVYHNPKRPFVISAGQNEVHALGTSFNVMAWPDEEEITVTMESGLTVFYSLEKNSEKTKVSELRKGEQLVYNSKYGSIAKSKVTTECYTSWKDGKLIFRNEPMEIVLKKLGRWYNVDFVVDNKEIEDYRYRATFVDESLDEVLKLLEHTSPVGYKEIERELLADESYSKKRIELFIRP